MFFERPCAKHCNLQHFSLLNHIGDQAPSGHVRLSLEPRERWISGGIGEHEPESRSTVNSDTFGLGNTARVQNTLLGTGRTQGWLKKPMVKQGVGHSNPVNSSNFWPWRDPKIAKLHRFKLPCFGQKCRCGRVKVQISTCAGSRSRADFLHWLSRSPNFEKKTQIHCISCLTLAKKCLSFSWMLDTLAWTF